MNPFEQAKPANSLKPACRLSVACLSADRADRADRAEFQFSDGPERMILIYDVKGNFSLIEPKEVFV